MSGVDRRDFLRASGGCAAHLALMSAGAPAERLARWASGASVGTTARVATPHATVALEPWGRLERVAEGVWAMVSTPLSGDRTTLCNGGLIAGRDGVLMVEAFGTDAGAKWMTEQARTLTGKAPTHVVVTHYHSDHTAGIRGAREAGAAQLHATAVTRDLTSTRNQGAPVELLKDALVVDPAAASTVDLGGRRVRLSPHDGHTPSDVSVRVEDVPVLFTGDLVWNGMFPNFVDAIPSRLSRSVRALRATDATTFVPGHGTVATAAQLDGYIALLDSVEAAARAARARGVTAEAAATEYRIPESLGEWTLFNPRYFERAIGAWMKELATP